MTWQLAVSGYCGRNLPLKVDAQRKWKFVASHDAMTTEFAFNRAKPAQETRQECPEY
jgi:hypothetical protein